MPKSPSQFALSAQLQRRTEDPGRAAERSSVRPEDADDSQKTAQLAGRAAIEKKGTDVLLLDLRGMSGYADFLVLASGNNERQLEAIADEVEKALRAEGHRLVGAEGNKSSHWQLLDFGDVVVHVFHEDERHHYDLEGLWADAPRTRMFEPAPRAESVPASV